MGHKIQLREHADLLLQSLLDLYDQLIINLTNKIPMDIQVFNDIVVDSMEEESQRKKKENRLTSLQQVKAIIVMRGRAQVGHSSKSRSKKNAKWCNYGKKSYLKKDCWNLDKKDSNPQGNIANISNDGDVMVCKATTTTGKIFADVAS